jgi:cytochrome c peroxidase
MKAKLFISCTIILACLVLTQCIDENANSGAKFKYENATLRLESSMPDYVNADVSGNVLVNNFYKKSVTNNDIVTLGRVLFYDRNLSINGKVACGSCHKQEFAFADNVSKSIGFDGQKTIRNSLAISNVVTKTSLFWDLRESNLTEMVLQPVKNHIEMGMEKIDALDEKLSVLPYYQILFKKAFGVETITKDKIAASLRQFLCSMASTNSILDGQSQGSWFEPTVVEDLPLSDNEKAGGHIFFGKGMCASCHFGVDEGFSKFDDIGLDANPTDGVVGKLGRFKVPNLRNVALSAPYMHDGRFKSLADVVDHYSDNIQASPSLSWRLRDQSNSSKPLRLNLSVIEKENLVLFLHKLTDDTFINDSKFSDPFVR